ncbi:zinc ribbon domain-containing protein [Cronobacter turicensis]
MKYVGGIALIVGVIWSLVAFNMDINVATGHCRRVNNIGLIAMRQNYIFIGAFITFCGLLVTIFGSRKNESGPLVKCPFCAEMVKPEAVKCRHCNSNLIPKQTPKHNLWIPSLYFSLAWGKPALNRGAVADLVCSLLASHIGMERKEIIDKYSVRITTLVNSMPHVVRQPFLDYYNQLMCDE